MHNHFGNTMSQVQPAPTASRRRPARRATALLLVGVAALASGGCGKGKPKGAQRSAPEVSVVTAHVETVPLTREVVGRLAPTRVAQVQARVAGIILKRVYTEGSDVKAGQVLFQIDPAPLRAALHAQEAALAMAQANAANARQTATRDRHLAAKQLISQQTLDDALANARTTAAAVKQAKANVETAQLNLGYATVTAPISGRAGRALVTEGALVGQGQATELTTVEQIDPIYINFSQSVGELQQLERGNTGTPAANPKATLQVLMPDGTPYPHQGHLDFSDISVDPNTGAISLRGIIPNPDHRLLPGMFVSVKMTFGQLPHAFLLPQACVQRDQKGAYVLVVGKDGTVARREVKTHGLTRTDWVVTGALHDGDRVIVDGIQKVRSGAKAKAVPAAGDNGAKR